MLTMKMGDTLGLGIQQILEMGGKRPMQIARPETAA